jgi:hypothetical protein
MSQPLDIPKKFFTSWKEVECLLHYCQAQKRGRNMENSSRLTASQLREKRRTRKRDDVDDTEGERDISLCKNVAFPVL